MKHIAMVAVLFGTSPLAAAEDQDPDLTMVSEADAINCHLDAPTYQGFALSISGEDGLAIKRQWRKVETENPFLDEYELPTPILVTATYQTRRIAFSSSGVMAILDLADPNILARDEAIANAMDPEPLIAELIASGRASRAEIEAEMPFRKFLGERVLVDVTELPTGDESFGTHTIVARTLSNATSHPGKTLYGCSYRIELIGKDGKPL